MKPYHYQVYIHQSESGWGAFTYLNDNCEFDLNGMLLCFYSSTGGLRDLPDIPTPYDADIDAIVDKLGDMANTKSVGVRFWWARNLEVDRQKLEDSAETTIKWMQDGHNARRDRVANDKIEREEAEMKGPFEACADAIDNCLAENDERLALIDNDIAALAMKLNDKKQAREDVLENNERLQDIAAAIRRL